MSHGFAGKSSVWSAVIAGTWIAGAAQAQSVILVDQAADGAARDGTSWCSAFVTLDDALSGASSGDVILVANGVYTPDTTGLTDPREATFRLKSGVSIAGGFAGCNAPDPNERNVGLHTTVLSGDLDGDDGPDGTNTAENTHHVVTTRGLSKETRLDGFTIRGGNADFPIAPDLNGGGMLIEDGGITVVDCRLTGNAARNSGGAVYLGSSSNSTFVNCTFSANQANQGGGLLAVLSANTTLINCVFVANAAAAEGGALALTSSSASLTNCTFVENSAGTIGGGLRVSVGSDVGLTNSILWANRDAGGVDESAQLHNLGAKVSVHYSCVEGLTGGFGGLGNISVDPRFADLAGADGILGTGDDELHLLAGSPCNDAGSNAVLPADIGDLDADDDTAERIPLDRAFDARKADDLFAADTGFGTGPIVDMGAFEAQLNCDDFGPGATIGLEPGPFDDCNQNGVPDECDLAGGSSADCNDNEVPDECDLAKAPTLDGNGNGFLDECEVPVVSAAGCRYLALSLRLAGDAPAVALRVTSPDFPCFERYVLPNAQLGDAAVFQTYGQWGTTRVGSQDIIPETTYLVRAQQQDGSLSEAGQATTNSWGDVIGVFRDGAWTPGNGIVDILDLTAALDRFINRPGAPPLEWCDVGPAVPDRIVDITTDVLAIVDAFRSLPYPYPTPCP